MSRESAVGAGVIVLALLVVIAFGSGLVGARTHSEIVDRGPLPDPPADGSAGIVVQKHTYPHSFLGFRWGRESQALDVQLVLTPGCASLLDDRAGAADDDRGCLEILSTGELAGEGRNVYGQRIVGLRVKVSGECFDAVSYGDRWPHQSPHCRD